jgi:hypothetical protein
MTLPFGFPFAARQKWEMNETRFAQTAFISCPFLTCRKRQRQSGIQIQLPVQKQLSRSAGRLVALRLAFSFSFLKKKVALG